MNPRLAHLFMVCSNIKLTGPEESIGIDTQAIHEWNQRDFRPARRGRALSRPSTFFCPKERKDVDARDI
jgi:hypothetical protein